MCVLFIILIEINAFSLRALCSSVCMLQGWEMDSRLSKASFSTDGPMCNPINT